MEERSEMVKKAESLAAKAVVDTMTKGLDDAPVVEEPQVEPSAWTDSPGIIAYDKKEFKPVKGYKAVRSQRPDGVYANLVCPNGALHCIRIEKGDAVVIVRRNGEFVDMVVKTDEDMDGILKAAAMKMAKAMERVFDLKKTRSKK